MHISTEVLPLDRTSGVTKKFLLIESPQATIKQLFPKIEEKYLRSYVDSSWHSTFAIKTIQDDIGNDLDISYTIGDIFEGRETPHVLRVIQTRNDREQSIQVTSTFRPPNIRPLPSKRVLPPVPLWNETSSKRRRLDDDAPKAYADLDSDRAIPSLERDVVEETAYLGYEDREVDADEEDAEVEDEDEAAENHEHFGKRGVDTLIASEERIRRNSPAVFRVPELPASRSKTPSFLRNPYSVDRQTAQSRRFGDRSRVRPDVFQVPDSENEVVPLRRRLETARPQVAINAPRRVSDPNQDLADPLITPDSTRMQAQLALAHAQNTAAQVPATNTGNVDQRPTYVQGHRAEPLVTTHESEDDAKNGEEEPFPAFAVEEQEQAGADSDEQVSSSSDEEDHLETGGVTDEARDHQSLRTPFTSFSRPTREPQTKHAESSSRAATTKHYHPATEDAHERLQSATSHPSQLPQVLDSQPKAPVPPKWIPQPQPPVVTNLSRNTEGRDLRTEHSERQLAAKKAKDREAERLRRAHESEAALAADKIPRVNLRTDDWMIRKGPQAADVFDFINDMPAPSRPRRKSAPRATTQAPETVKSPPKTIGRVKSIAPKTATKSSYTGWDKPEASSSQMQPPSTAKRKSEPSEDLSSKKQAKIDFKRKGRAIPQHMLEQDPITVSDTESVQIISRTMVGNPGKEPVVVINSPVNSPPRKTTQRPGTKPQNIVPRCLPCRGTHKPCEPDANDLDGPCKRCAKLGCPCKLTDGTTRIRKTITSSAEGVSSRRKLVSKPPASSFPFPSSQPAAASPTPAPRGKGPTAAHNAHQSTTTMQARSPSYEEGSPMTNDQLIGAYNKALSASQASLSATQMSSQGSTSKPPESSTATATAPSRTRLVSAPSKQPARMTTIPGRDYFPPVPKAVAPATASLQRTQSSQDKATLTSTQTSAFATQPNVGAPSIASLQGSQSLQHKATPADTQISAFATQPDLLARPKASLRWSQRSLHKAAPATAETSAFTMQSMPHLASSSSTSKAGTPESSSDSQPSPGFQSGPQAHSASESVSPVSSSDSRSSPAFHSASQAHSFIRPASPDRASVSQPTSQAHSVSRPAFAKSGSVSQPTPKLQSASQAYSTVKPASPTRSCLSQPAPRIQSASPVSQAQPAVAPAAPERSSVSQTPGFQSLSQVHAQSQPQIQPDSQMHSSQHQVDGPAYSSDSSSSSESLSEGENDFITDVQQTQINDAPEAKKGSLRKDFIGKLWTDVKRAVFLGAAGMQKDWYAVPDEQL